MHISGSSISHNVGFTLGYSTITLKDGIHAVIKNTTFKNNSALGGGALIAQDQCKVTLISCTFSSNKAVTAKALTLLKNPNVEMKTTINDENGTIALRSPRPFNRTWLRHQTPESITRKKLNISRRSAGHHLDGNNIRTFASKLNRTFFRPKKLEVIPAKRMSNSTARSYDQNNTGKFKPVLGTLFNQTSSAAKEPETDTAYQTHPLTNSSVLRNTVQQAPGIGGAVFVATHSQLLMTNCRFEDNSAQYGAGAIGAGLNVTLDVQGTMFVGNKALVLLRRSDSCPNSKFTSESQIVHL